MRTSYRMSHGGNENPVVKDREVEEVQQEVRDSHSMLDMKKEIEKSQEAMADQVERSFLEEESIKAYREIVQKANPDTDIGDIVEKAEDGVAKEEKQSRKEKKEQEDVDKKKRNKKRIIVGFSILGVIFAFIAVFFVYTNFFRQDNSIEAIAQRVEKLYTSADKVDIKNGVTQSDLSEFYVELSEAARNGDDTKSVESEIDTIGYFLSDKEQLNEYNSEDFDLTTVGMTDSLNTVKANADSYTVSGLAVTITDLANQVQSDYDSFIALRSELQGVTDVTTFDATAYKARIDEVTHTHNKEELTALYDKLVADQEAAQAQAELEAAATEEAKAQAEKALEEAQKIQQETQEKLDQAQEELANKAEEAANSIKDKIFGSDSSGSGESSESSTEENNSVDTQSKGGSEESYGN